MNKFSDYTMRDLSLCVAVFKRPDWIVQFVPDDECRERPFRIEYTSTQFLNSCRYFRKMNADGYHVYARPDTTRHILVDDFDKNALAHLVSDGLTPALVIMTSPDNYQAWITVSDAVIPPDLADSAAKLLASRYNGDKGSADSKHLGRLPQLKNRKSKYRDADGNYPWTRIVGTHRTGVAVGATDLLIEAQSLTSSTPRGACVFRGIPINGKMTPEQAIETYKETRSELHYIDKPNDRSLVDYSIAMRLLNFHWGAGFSVEDVAMIIRHGSEKGRERGDEYAMKTAQSAVDATFNFDR